MKYILLLLCSSLALLFSLEDRAENGVVDRALACDVVARFVCDDNHEELDVARRANSLFRTPQQIHSVESARSIVDRDSNVSDDNARSSLRLSSKGGVYAVRMAKNQTSISRHIIYRNFRL